MSSLALNRLTEERKNWRKDYPTGFYAKPLKKADNSMDLLNWELGIPGKEGTDWEGGLYKVMLRFPPNYPTEPPKCKFTPPIYHPNVFQGGEICLSILNEDQDYRPSITVKQIAMGIQDLLDNPNPRSPANGMANEDFTKRKAEYKKKVRAEAKKHAPDI